MTNTKQTIILFVLLISNAFPLIAQNCSDKSDAILGTWLMPNNEGILEIFKENKLYHGKIIWLKKTEEDGSPLKDKENPNKNLRNREVVGLRVMNNFKYEYENENVWNGGTFYAARKGKKAEPDFILINENQLNIKISIFIFSKTIPLIRVDTAKYFNRIFKKL